MEAALRLNNIDSIDNDQLAFKLRKIKENLDNCYSTPTTQLKPVVATNQDINQFVKKNYFTDSSRYSSNTNTSSTSSISKLLFLNNDQNFDFSLNNDFIMDQFKKETLIKKQPSTTATVINTTNLVSLKQTIYQDNLSRQSSIRSLITSEENNKNITVLKKPTNVNLINSASSGVLASVGVCTIPTIKSSNENTLNHHNYHHNKIKQIKAKNQAQTSPVYSKHEIELLKDWDNYKPTTTTATSSTTSNSTTTSQTNSNKINSNSSSPIQNNIKQNNSRPETRLGFQQGDTPDSLTIGNENNFQDCFDNASMVSSSPMSSVKNFKTSHTVDYDDYQEEPEEQELELNLQQTTPLGIEKKIIQNNNGRVSVESVLSNFVSNLKFEEFSKNSNPSSSKKSFDEFNQDYDVVTVSEALTDDIITTANKRSSYTSSQTPSSLIIREKFKQDIFNHQIDFDPDEYQEEDIDEDDDDDDDDNRLSTSSNQRVKNYQRLSHSINDLFSNLLQQLERQKNKDYYEKSKNQNQLTSLNDSYQIKTDDMSRFVSNSFTKPSQSSTGTKNSKNQNLSKDSNKDSGFNQEFIYDNRLNKLSNSFDQNSQQSYSNDPQQQLKNDSLKPNDKLLCDDLSELSLLDRFLNNEQLVAFKHTKIEKILAKKFNIKDFSIVEYILNQEGISLITFNSLIKEKFKTFKWTDDILYDLHKIINQPIETNNYANNNNNNNNIIETNQFYDDSYYNSDEKKLIDHDFNVNLTEDKKSSQTNSLKSFKKIKLIKTTNNSNKRNKMNQSLNIRDDDNDLQDNSELIIDESFKNTLSNSFTKRRERKGSLPEINTSHIVEFENIENQLYDNSNNNLSMSNQTLIPSTTNDNQDNIARISRKSAFVLEVLRTSMFRSKSLSDLSTSLVKIEKNTNHFNHQNQNNCLSTNHLNDLHDNSNHDFDVNLHDNYSISNFQVENYSGLIWQCADMNHDEYKNKYEELNWLMNGDNLSVSSKLKEVEQRLRIEYNIKEKNLNLINKINTENLSLKNKSIYQRLESQLKVISEKIKDLERMRLFLKMCEINNNGLDTNELNIFFNLPNNKYNKHNLLEAKTCNEILKSLYDCESVCSGFVYQFFVVYRYMFSSLELLEYLKTNFIKALASNHNRKKSILDRTIELIGMWIDGFYIVDFQQNQELIEYLDLFIENQIKTYDESKYLMIYNLLTNPRVEFNLFNALQNKYEHKNKKIDSETKKVNRLLNAGAYKKKLAKSKSSENLLNENEETGSNVSVSNLFKRANFSINDYPCELVASQLTLIEWDNFLDIHVCHCLNSRAQGVNCDAKQPIDPSIINTKQCLFVDNYLSKSVYKMIQFNFLLTHWVSAEILIIDNLKSQVNLITKFLKIAKKCYDWSNFSSAFAIYDGLQEVTVRNLRAWQQVSNKTFQILDKIASVKILFQNEPYLLSHLAKSTNTPVIPSMHLFLLVVQKSEHGNFKLANGEWKWSKLSQISNLVDQIRIIQQHYKCCFVPCEQFVDELLQRIYYFKVFDLNNLAENSSQDYFHNQRFNSTPNTSIKSLIPKKR